MTVEGGPPATSDPDDRRRAQRGESIVSIILSVLAIAIATAVSASAAGSGFSPAVADRLPMLRIALALALVSCAVLAIDQLRARATARLRRRWWDPSDGRPEGPLSWDHIYTLVAFDPERDPLLPVDSSRAGRRIREWLPAALAIAVIILVTAQSLDFLWNPTPWPGVFSGGDTDRVFRDVVGASGNLTAYLALLASAITIVFTYGQLQARVRADSRQQWIIQARTLLAETLAAAEAHRAAPPWSRTKARQEMDQRRLALELMLNPSEKDHRLLLYLIQRHALIGLAGEDDIQDARSVRYSIAHSGSAPQTVADVAFDPPVGPARPDLGRAWNSVLYANRREDLLAYALRLAHVVLKREWERVKHTR